LCFVITQGLSLGLMKVLPVLALAKVLYDALIAWSDRI